MTIDFEAIDTIGTWLGYGIIIAEYPSGKILDIQEQSCERNLQEYSPRTMEFWKQHQEAHDYLVNNGKGIYSEVAEQELCLYIVSILKKYPNIYLISDNPQYDIRLLDNLMQKHNHSPVSVRGKDLYFQCLCTWSFQNGILSLLQKKPKDINQVRNSLALCYDRHVDGYFGPRHAPLADCARIISQHFKMLDIINGMKIYQ
jgi:hypothetical protein